MKVHLLNLKLERFLGFLRTHSYTALLLVVMVGLKSPLWAEGSVDFVSYPGHRMFLDTRDPQQLKVYANAGETINVGSSHVGIQGGFITIYDPSGNVFVTFNNTGNSTGLAIINNSVEELSGPTGGGTTNGNGYVPGTVTVPAGMEGIWTVVFDYPTYQNLSFNNILNNAPWTRAFDQPPSQRVVLAWDITVSQNGAGNMGGTPLQGRVYSNEHISLLQGNGVTTSPTFYVLTEDGYLYEVIMNMADPFRFPISSNSFGLLDGNLNPIYKSKPESSFRRSADPSTWDTNNPDSIYLFEPQAQGIGPLTNNKIFFNIPNPDLPITATATDIFRNNTHVTWLLSEFEGLEVDTFYFSTFPCQDGIMQFDQGGHFFISTNLGGVFTLQLDLNNNNIFNDPVDVSLSGTITEGLDSIFWDGRDGFGVPIPVQSNFNINYLGEVRFGELHIALTDVEANMGGVTFKWMNAPTGVPNDQFYYDHSDIDPNIALSVSGGGTPGNALPTNIPYTYPFNNGNDVYFDQWFFVGQSFSSTIQVDIVLDCICDPEDFPQISLSAEDVCEGEAIVITANNINQSQTIPSINYIWSGPDNYSLTETGLTILDQSLANVTASATLDNQGIYQVIASTPALCMDTATIAVQVTQNPILTTDEPTAFSCAGGDIQFCATNTVQGLGILECVLTGPNGFFETAQVDGDNQICFELTNVDPGNAGDYTLVCSLNGCASNALLFTVSVGLTPEIDGIAPNDDFCVGSDVTLTANNNVPNTGPITYTWTGPNNFSFTAVANDELGPFTATIPNIQADNAGEYTLVLTSGDSCNSVAQSVLIGVNPIPIICNTSGGGDACVGQTVSLNGFNCAAGLSGTTNYEWLDPTGTVICSGSLDSDGPFNCEVDNIQPSGSGEYCLTLTDANTNCVSEQVCLEINVLPNIVLTDVTPDSNYCGGTSVTLTASTSFGDTITYTWTGPNGSAICVETVPPGTPLECTISNLTAANDGDYTLTVISQDGCESDPVTVSVGLLDGVKITSTTGGGPVCDDDDLMLSGTGTSTSGSVNYVWTSPSGQVVGMGNTPPAGPYVTTNNSIEFGTYTLIVSSDPDGCSDTATVIVSPAEIPTPIIINGSDTSLCDVDSLLLCAQNTNPNIDDFTYTWTTPNNEQITGQGNGLNPFCELIDPVSLYGEGAYTLVICAGSGCCSDPVTYNVNLNPTPIMSQVTGGGTYCEGDTAIVCFTNLNPDVTNWFYTCNIDTIQVTDTGFMMNQICVEITEPTFIFCSLESFDGCVSDLQGTEVLFEPSYTPEVEADSAICANDTLQLNGFNTSALCSGTVTYTWTGPNGFTFTDTAACAGPFPAIDPNPSSGEYCLVLNGGGSADCSEQVCTTVVVFELPFVVGGTINGGGEDFCEGDDIVLSATIENPSGGDINYEWTLNGDVIGSGTATSGETITLDLSPADTLDNGSYCLNLTCADTGCSDEGVGCTDVTVNISPIIDEVTGADTYCQGSDVMLNGSGPAGPGTVVYTWTGPDGFNFQGSAACGGPYPATISDVDSLNTGVYTLVVEKGGCSDSMSLSIEVNPTPDIINVSSGGEECEGAKIPISFTIDPDGADTVFWEIIGPGLDTGGLVTILTDFEFEIMVMGDMTFTITAVSNLGCEADPINIEITEIMVPPPTITTETEVACPGEPITFCTPQVAGASYSWCFNGTLIAGETGSCITVDNPQEGCYTVKITVQGCVEESECYNVVFPDSPVAVDDSYTTIAGEPVGGNVLDNDDTAGGVDVSLVSGPSNGSVSLGADGQFVYTPDLGFSGTDQFTYEICLTECTLDCDQAVVTIVVEVPPCIVPNVITPDGDGINDILIIDCAPVYPNNSLRIFNRWGDEIEVFEPYENTWDGTIGSSKDPVPAGTYYYIFQEDRTTSDHQAGYVKVVR